MTIENGTILLYGFLMLVSHCEYLVFCIIFEIYDVEEYRDLEIQIKDHSPCEFIHEMYIGADARGGGTMFLALIVLVYLRSLLHSEI